MPVTGAFVPQGIELAELDGQIIGYATFQSHNQKVVSNAYGIFTTHVRNANEYARECSNHKTWQHNGSDGECIYC